MSRLLKALVLSISVAVFAFVAMGFVLQQSQPAEKTYRSLTVYSQVLQHIQQDYVEDPNLPLVTTGALRGLLESLDAQSSYLSPEEYAAYVKQSKALPEGEIGADLTKRFGYVAVVSVLPDSPAQRAGIRGGDILENIAGFTTREMSLEQARVLLAGIPGSIVKVAMVRRGRSEPQEVEIVRGTAGSAKLVTDRFDADPATPDSTVAYLRVPALTKGKADEIRQQLVNFDRQGLRRLILDLRECARGDISEGVAVARLFLNAGTIAVRRGQTVDRQEFLAEPGKSAWDYPVAVLTSNGTAGAAEIVAAAIAGNQRGPVVGARTAGTASEQRWIPLEDGAALFLTVANYHTPAGKPITEEGATPTVSVDGDDFTAEFYGTIPPRDKDKVLDRALDLVRGKSSPAAAAPAKAASRRTPAPWPDAA
jgi:carboxyl-terminal processing protease